MVCENTFLRKLKSPSLIDSANAGVSTVTELRAYLVK
jgi:hypothetical protein